MIPPLYAQVSPSRALAPYIECYWMLSAPAGQGVPLQHMPADGRVELMFSFGAGSRRVALDHDVDQRTAYAACDVHAHSFVLGGRGRGYTLDHFGAPRYVCVRFKPGGFGAFVRQPLIEMTDVYVDLDCVWDQHTARQLEMQLEAASSPHAQADILDAALLARHDPPDHLPRLMYAARRLQTTSDHRSMTQLADELNFSQKHYERLFARYIGFRPGLFARIARFQHSIALGAQQDSISLSQLALRAGYYDQAHFNRDFKQFAGSTPHLFFSQTSDYVRLSVQPQQVDFVQDRLN